MKYLITALTCATLASAHFELDYPTVRGFNEDNLSQFPCGGQNTPSTNRTVYPLTGGQIALDMGHSQSDIQVTLGLGNDPGTAFNYVLKPTFTETGLGGFCFSIAGASTLAGVNITEGTNATIQVLTNGDPEGGLYNCADITFSASAVAVGSDVCKNNTGVTASTSTVSGSPNGTTSSGTTTSTGASATKTPGAGAVTKASVGGVLVAAGAALVIVL
ncbi:hypothetical protein B0O99DRAFT_501764 [Bisporella sp. PMI_857]|nr:hypothetical protein B0O99DRAFT_501764 [Bisporella sp. PMI_857]